MLYVVCCVCYDLMCVLVLSYVLCMMFVVCGLLYAAGCGVCGALNGVDLICVVCCSLCVSSFECDRSVLTVY